jgi:hypothetical protein
MSSFARNAEAEKVSDIPAPAKDVVVHSSFDTMGFQEDLLRGIYTLGFETPCDM